MNNRRLNKIQGELDSFRRRGGVKSNEIESLAKRLGRTEYNRGKEPTWVNNQFPNLRPLSIPHHGTSDLNKYTLGGIFDQLEEDIEQWRELLKTDGGDR